MKLIKFRVKNYKTIDDTGWISIDQIGCLVGVNESGKTNVITALLKLNPVDSSIKINALLDYPRSKYSSDKDKLDDIEFIEALFEFSEPLSLSNEDGETVETYKYLKVRKTYDESIYYYGINDINDEENKGKEMNDTDLEEELPNFIYYASYASLDSELHLPTIISKMSRNEEMSEKSKNKVKTLKVLFDYIKLKPQDILNLGKETNPGSTKSESTIENESANKKEREILLDSAATKLTRDFKSWWKQGDYIFNFSVDGDYFRIWVSDNIRHDKIELESRSSGLQWFFSFFLIFMSEADHEHKNTIILLDEPGHTLHPMAQKDLSLFFNELSTKNQLIYTTHSPFLVDAMNITQTKVVYFEGDGITQVSDDLQINKNMAKKSIYPINSAIGITVSDTMLIGCKPIIVEGVSDQIYMTFVKRFLMKIGEFMSTEELIFMPVGGTKNIKPVVSIISGRDSDLPFIIVDSDESGQTKKKSLEKDLYVNEKDKILNINDFIIKATKEAEIEDFMDVLEIEESFNREFRFEEDFVYDENDNNSVVKQIESFCQKQDYKLCDGWKVLVARRYIQRNKKPSDKLINKWKELFDKIK